VATTRHEGEAALDLLAIRAVRQGSRFQARLGSRAASARSDSGLRSGLASERRRPTLPLRSGTAKVGSGP